MSYHTERPLLVSGPLINPILRGEKRVTRRLVRDVEAIPFPGLTWDTVRIRSISILDGIPCATWATADGGGGGPISRRAAPCAVGDVLWVRETWALWRTDTLGEFGGGDEVLDTPWEGRVPLDRQPTETAVLYRERDADEPDEGPWRPSIHMPRWAARIFLRVEDVRVERVQDITEEDARAEGVIEAYDGVFDDADYCARAKAMGAVIGDARPQFAQVWDSLAPAGSKWADNPWVWRIGFALVKPIDFSIAAMYAAPTKPTQSPKPIPAEPPPLVARCTQCGHAYGIAYHTRSIYRRGRGWSDERFCSEACGANYQMGCE